MWLKLLVFIFVFCVKNSRSGRRIVMGKPSLGDKGFMVYLVKSEQSNMKFYDSWICGGAIVSPTHILTAAACISDVSHIYAIAGYKKYVRTEYLDTDECTKNRKQRVIKTCTPKAYSFNYGLAHRWVGMDIGFAIVEKPYNFSDLTYRMDCSYVPRAISINFDPKYTEMHENMIIYGWGHSRSLRLPGDTTNYNSLYLQEASTRMVTKRYCKGYFKDEQMQKAIQQYMICTIGAGNFDSEGEIIDHGSFKYENGCRRRHGMANGECGDHDYDIDDYSLESRRNASEIMDIGNSTGTPLAHNKTRTKEMRARRQGICQNDHGGPLVTWVGSKEVVVGVASTSLHDEHNYCIAPSLHTSTHCTMRFIMCGLQLGIPNTESGRKMCENLGKEEGYELNEADIDWGDEVARNNSSKSNAEISETNKAKSTDSLEPEPISNGANTSDTMNWYALNSILYAGESSEKGIFEANKPKNITRTDDKEVIEIIAEKNIATDTATDDVVVI